MATSYTSNKKIGALDSASTPLAATNEIVINQNGDILKTPLSAVEAKVFDAKTAVTTPTGTEVVVVRQTDNTLRQVALANIVPALNITNAKVSASAAIADTKLATINTAGKVTNQAVQAVSTNTANRIVARDNSGNFSAGTITATLSGNASTATNATTAGQVGHSLSAGNYLLGSSFNGSAARTWDVNATSSNVGNSIVARDGSGNFSAGNIAATSATIGLVTGSLAGNVTGDVTGDVTGNVTGNVTGSSGSCTGNSATATTLQTSRNFQLAGDVTSSAVAFNGGGNVTLTGTIANGSVTLAKLASAVQQLLVPVGSIVALAHSTIPSGWVLCNGAEYAKTGTYAALFAVLQTYYGETNGSGGAGTSHFRVPDLRGAFIRGSGSQVVNGVTYTAGTFGRMQQDAFQGHRHAVSHNAVTGPGLNGSGGSPPLILGGATITILDPVTDGGNGTPRVASETRPVNMPLNYIIKF